MNNIPSLTVWQGVRGKGHFLLGSFLYRTGIAGVNSWLHEKTMRQLQRAAELRHPKALVLFGQLLLYKGATPYNQMAGVSYLRQAAEEGNSIAQFFLAEALVKKDLITAKELDEDPVYWYLEAANQGHTMAALRLSKIFHNGLYGKSIDETQAQFWRDKFMSNSGLEV